MASELEAAAAVERLGGMPTSYEADWNARAISFQQVQDLLAVYHAYLREHDQTPVDASWLREILPDNIDDDGVLHFDATEFSAAVTIYPDGDIWVDNAVVTCGANRGQVRLLCAALGIELTEATE